ncbi:ABC transporter permease [Curtobacterium sp. MCBD17_013]|uniref:ABC transporter permease n=1 Tax=Curtobacterium sp. MCBD17_013 TaxID=2175668 RepID=UPI000DA98437|nr:ABC transporter permease [Curtobacterium sp. MCBD17_013]PZF59080.1 ABC transporter permease [Curtobacterium sp. MCBD17_013]
MTWSSDIGPSLLGVGVLVVVATVVLLLVRAPSPVAPALAVLRGALQLAVISVVLSGVIHDVRWVAAALVVMFTVAVSTASRRLGPLRRTAPMVASAMGAGILLSLAVVFVTGAIAFDARYALAIGGIVVGNAMTVATLAGRRFLELVDDRWEEVEGWLALGAPPRTATRDLARRAVHAALIPSTDQTRTTGLVTLPGAFVGAIFGGVSPVEAGRFQIVVLAAIIATGAVTAAIVVRWLGPVRTRPTAPR